MSHPTSPISQHLPGHLLLLPLKAEVKQVRVGGGHVLAGTLLAF